MSGETRVPTLAALAVASWLALSEGAVAAGAADATAPVMEIARHGSRWTLRLQRTPLAEALRAIAARAGVKLSLRGDLATPVTATLTDVPLDEGIKRLARGHSVCLLYDPPGPAAGGRTADRLTEVLVIENPPAARAPARVDLQQRLSRLRTVRLLGMRRDAESATALARMIAEDDDPVVRRRAVSVLAGSRASGADAVLARALRSDADPQVRRAAALALAPLRTEEARRALEAAAADPDESVRSAASSALGRSSSR